MLVPGLVPPGPPITRSNFQGMSWAIEPGNLALVDQITRFLFSTQYNHTLNKQKTLKQPRFKPRKIFEKLYMATKTQFEQTQQKVYLQQFFI